MASIADVHVYTYQMVFWKKACLLKFGGSKSELWSRLGACNSHSLCRLCRKNAEGDESVEESMTLEGLKRFLLAYAYLMLETRKHLRPSISDGPKVYNTPCKPLGGTEKLHLRLRSKGLQWRIQGPCIAYGCIWWYIIVQWFSYHNIPLLVNSQVSSKTLSEASPDARDAWPAWPDTARSPGETKKQRHDDLCLGFVRWEEQQDLT